MQACTCPSVVCPSCTQGAMPVYPAVRFYPHAVRFWLAAGVQALVFEPQDMTHLAVNFP